MNPAISYRVVRAAGLVTALAGCAADLPDGGTGAAPVPTVASAHFGTLATGEPVTVFTLANGNDMEVRVLDYGAAIQSIRVPDRDGRVADVTLGYDDLGGYLNDRFYMGVVAGRYANRIADGRFTIDGRTYRLARNNGPNHLHGGVRGFDKVRWRAEPFQRGDSVGVVLHYTSPDGEEGYPGTLEARVTYTLTPRNELVIAYHATTDAPTHVNLTQHTYFNLAGAGTGDVLGHELSIDASRYTPIDSTAIPLAGLTPVEGTPFDFRTRTPVGARIDKDDPQLGLGDGYNHNYVLDRVGDSVVHAARVVEPTTGRALDVYTSEPGLQFYSGNRLDGSAMGKDGHVYGRRAGFCLETQHFPNSPNRPDFPSTLLRPDETYESRTVFVFGVAR